MTDTHLFDAAIVGGGPAGLSAAVWLARYLHSVVLIDSGDPRNWETRGIHGYLGFGQITPAELRGRGREEARRFGANLVDGCVDRAERMGDDQFRLALADGRRFDARRLLLAYGIRDIWPDVPGLGACYGASVHHCPDCDGHEARGCRTVVIANRRKAAGMALALATWTRDLIICTNGEPFELDDVNAGKLRALGVPVHTGRIRALEHVDGDVRSIEVDEAGTIECERVFFAIGHYPADDLAEQLGCERDEEGLVLVDDTYHTSAWNVFAAGDLVPGPHLAVPAAADGCIAALAMHKSLLPEALTIA
jgi:thioredoxin reductase